MKKLTLFFVLFIVLTSVNAQQKDKIAATQEPAGYLYGHTVVKEKWQPGFLNGLST